MNTKLILIQVVFLTLKSDPNVLSEEVDRLNWIDWSLPRSVEVKPFYGVRYEAEVPDTADIVFHASCALNMATRLWVPEWGYEQLFDIWMDTNPPRMEVGHGGLTDCGPKVIESLPMLRAMTGSTYNINEDGNAMMSIVRITGKDGLCYQPVENRPWAFFDDYSRQRGTPFADVFGEGRQLLAYAAWYQHDQNPLWRDLAQRKMRRLLELTLPKEDTLYFRTSRGYNPWDKDQAQGELVPIGDHHVYEAEKGMVGTAAACVSGFIPMAGAIWYRLTEDPSYRELSRGLAKYLYLYGELLDAETGQFLADHETHVTHSLIANLSWALTFDDREMVPWVKRGYDYFLNTFDPDNSGVLFSQEACRVGDLIGLGIMLSQSGEGDYWDTVDHLIRNTFLNMQVTQADWIKSKPLEIRGTLDAGWYQPLDGADWCVGVWRHYLETTREQAAGCCNGNCSRMLYYIWDNIITMKDSALKVNLLLNRASPWADVDSWLPYEGRVKIILKSDQEDLQIRIPEWTEGKQVSCSMGGETVSGSWSGRYYSVGKVKKGEGVLIEFPIKTRTLKARLKTMASKDGEQETWDEHQCAIRYRGSTLIDITPSLHYPLAEHEKYRTDKAPMKKITRFVSEERFLF